MTTQLLTILANTGTVSFWLYGIFIGITIIAMIIAFYEIKKGTLEPLKLNKMIELFQYAIVTTAIATVGLIIANLFKEREQDVNELEYFDKYVEDIKKADGAEERWKLAKYLSIVAPSGDMKESWSEYFHYLDTGEHRRYVELQDSLANTKSDQTLTQAEQKNQEIKIRESLDKFERPLSSTNVTRKKPTIYIQYCNPVLKEQMLQIQDKFNANFWNAPGIDFQETGCDNSIRYFWDDDRGLADQANALLDNKFTVKRTYFKAPRAQIELWVGK